jgi:hypothetical protein
VQFITLPLDLLGLLFFTSPLVRASNSGRSPSWVPELSPHHSHIDFWHTVHSTGTPSGTASNCLFYCSVWSSPSNYWTCQSPQTPSFSGTVWFDLWLTVSRSVRLGVGPSFGAHDQIFPCLLWIWICLDSEVVHPLWRENGSIVCIAVPSLGPGRPGPITILYCLLQDWLSYTPGHCVPFLSPVMTGRATVEVF